MGQAGSAPAAAEGNAAANELDESDEVEVLIQEGPMNRPDAGPVHQQKLKSWDPLLTGKKLVVIYSLITCFFIPFGAVLLRDDDTTYDHSFQYDGDGAESDDCKITTYNEGRTCTIDFVMDKDVDGPVYVYYEIDDFYQNHERYVSCYSQDQLQGETDGDTSDCAPLTYNGSLLLNPCGLTANTYFNDVIGLLDTTTSGGETLTMEETGITWEEDLDRFSQPDGFTYAECELPGDCAACLGSSYADACSFVTEGGVRYAYFYPDEDTTQYLYETFPQISPLKGVTDEHFIVWMRAAGLPRFRKLYGIIKDDIPEGTTVSFEVTANFLVADFEGKKKIALSNTYLHGPKNPYLGRSFLATGSLSLLLAAIVLVKTAAFKREEGNIAYLIG